MFSSDEKGISLRLSLLSSYLLDLVVRKDPRQREFLQFLCFLVQCQLYLVTYGFHRKNISTTTGCFGGWVGCWLVCWMAKWLGSVWGVECLDWCWCVLESMFSGLGSNNDEGDSEV